MLTKTDYLIGGLIGFLAGCFAIPFVVTLGLRDTAILLLLPWGVGIVFGVGIFVANILSRKLTFIAQFGKFVAVGFLNTMIDFGILNLVSTLAGVTSGIVVGGVNVPGFVVAVSNSYFWNKFWVFKDKNKKLSEDFPQFVAVTIGGLLLNTVIVIALTSYIRPLLGLDPKRWLNIAKLIATIFTLVWNFVGYKFIVFRGKNTTQTIPTNPV